jgi:hypothetical protein
MPSSLRKMEFNTWQQQQQQQSTHHTTMPWGQAALMRALR